MPTHLLKTPRYKPDNQLFIRFLTYCIALPPATVLTVKHGIGISGIILISACLLSLLTNQGEHRPFSKKDRCLLLAFCAYPVIVFINTLYCTKEFEFGLIDYSFRFLFVLPVFLAIRRFQISAKFLYAGIIFGAIGAGLFAIYQRFILGIISTKGFVFHISFGDICILLGFMSLCSWPLFINSRYKNMVFFLILAAFALAVTGSILSTARGSWIAAPVLFLLIVTKYISNFILRLAISVAFISACIGLYATNENINSRVNLAASEINTYFNGHSTTDLTTNSVGSRLEMWKIGWMMFKEKPWMGIGTGNYYAVSGELIKTGKMQPGAHYNHAHNDYITLLAETGIVGFLSLLLLYGISWYYFQSGYKTYTSKQNISLALTGQLLIAGYAIFSLTQTNLGHQVTTFFLALMIATLAGMLNPKTVQT